MAALSVFVFERGIRCNFVQDDWVYLNVAQMPDWWRSARIWDPAGELWRPIFYLWFGGLHAIFGLHPLPYHLVTELVLLIEGYLVFRLARRLGLHHGAYVAGVLVTVHASMTIPTAWISAASSPLSVSLAIGAMLLTLSETRSERTWPRFVAALLLGLGLLTREIVVMAPLMVALIVVVELSGPARDRLKRALVVSGPLWVTVIAYGVIRSGFGFESRGAYQQQTSTVAIRNIGYLAAYLTGLVDPGRLRLTYGVAIAFWITILALGLLAAQDGQRQTLIGVGWAVLGVLPVVFLVNHSMDYYYVDFALPGLALAVGGITQFLLDRLAPSSAIVTALAVVGLACLGFVGRVVSNKQFDVTFAAVERRTAELRASLDSYQHQPGQKTLLLKGIVPIDVLAIQNGDIYRVLLHDPDLQVVGDLPLLTEEASP